MHRSAQQEIDKVVGNDRIPGIADMANLPYDGACVKETLRYWTVAPLGTHRQALLPLFAMLGSHDLMIGLPHRAMEDGRYQDYDIPAGKLP